MRIVPSRAIEKNASIEFQLQRGNTMNQSISARPTVLVLGAKGRFGAAAVNAFVAAGWQVRAQSRRAEPNYPAGVTAITTDAMDRAALCAAAEGVDVVINGLNPIYTEWEELARDLADNALKAAKSSGALLMMPGNVYNYGRQIPSELNVDTPQVGDHAKARIRIEIEQQMSDAALDGLNSLVVRAGDFFGGKVGGSWFDLVIAKSLKQEKLVYPGAPDVPHSWSYLPDLAQTFVQLAEQRAQFLGAHTVHFDGHTVTGEQLHTEVEALLGRPLKRATMPWGLVRLAAFFSPMLAATLDMRYLWQRAHRLNDSSLRQHLNSVPHTSLAQALAVSLNDLGLLVTRTSGASRLRHA
jgi:nucleoside-diphosphate-sugar epimerase